MMERVFQWNSEMSHIRMNCRDRNSTGWPEGPCTCTLEVIYILRPHFTFSLMYLRHLSCRWLEVIKQSLMALFTYG